MSGKKKNKINKNKMKKYNDKKINELKEHIEEFCDIFGFDLDNKSYTIELAGLDDSLEKIEAAGITYPPTSENDSFRIVINTKMKMSKQSRIEAAVHELTHMQDMIRYKKITNEDKYETLRDCNKYLMFQMWTEFNAYWKSYYYTIHSNLDESLVDVKQVCLNDIIKIAEYSRESINSIHDQLSQLYSIFSFMGHIYAWNKIESEIFNKSLISSIFSQNENLISVYEFLCKNNDLESAHKNFDELRKILNNIYKGIY